MESEVLKEEDLTILALADGLLHVLTYFVSTYS
jgi:hypothetical protein